MFLRLVNRPKDPIAHMALLQPLLVVIVDAIAASRFFANVAHACHERWGRGLQIDRIRRCKREWCGQHPNECVRGGKHRNSSLLEGADWVGFNDGLNDVLDRLEADIDVWSFNREAEPRGRFFIRKGLERRVEYTSHEVFRDGRLLGYLWDRDGEHENHCGKIGPRSDYPYGTPGLCCWTLKDEKRLAALAEHAEVD